jgi:hypothetical protein
MRTGTSGLEVLANDVISDDAIESNGAHYN